MARIASTAKYLRTGSRFTLKDSETAKVYYVTRTLQVNQLQIMVYINGCLKTKYFTMHPDKEVFKVHN